jgi:hypothetical protein
VPPRALVKGSSSLILGNYLLPPPHGSEYRLAYPPTFYPGATTVAEAAPVQIGVGEHKLGVDVQMRPVPAVSVSGRLEVSPDGAASVMLRLMPAGLENLGIGSEAATAVVARDGTFRFLNVPVGTYSLVSGATFEYSVLPLAAGPDDRNQSHPAYGPLPAPPGLSHEGGVRSGGAVPAAGLDSELTKIGINQFTSSSAPQVYQRVAVTVGTADVSGVVVPVYRSASLRCVIRVDNLKGPLGLGILQLSPADADPALTTRSVILRPEDFRGSREKTAVFENVLPGRYVIGTSNLPGVAIRSVTLDGADRSEEPFTVSSGMEATISVTLTGLSGTIRGRVQDDTAAPAAHTTVIAFPVRTQLQVDQGLLPSWIHVASSNASGSFELTGIREGSYYLVAVLTSTTKPWRDQEFLAASAKGAQQVSVKWGETRTVSLTVRVR